MEPLNKNKGNCRTEIRWIILGGLHIDLEEPTSITCNYTPQYILPIKLNGVATCTVVMCLLHSTI